jgi:NAD(P) transhydrogenase subunit beta
MSSKPLMLPGKNVLNIGALVLFLVLTSGTSSPVDLAARRRDRAGARARLAPGGLDRRRRHAGRRLDAQQLLRLGRGRGGLPAEQRPADRHRRARRLVGCVPVVHHVQGDEPVVPLGHRGGFGIEAPRADDEEDGEHRETDAEAVAELLRDAS